MTPQNKKYLTYGVVILGFAGIGYLILKKPDGSGSTEDPTGNGSNTPSTTYFNPKNVADALLDAMAETGTDEDAILSILKYITPVQFTAVKTAFGRVQYNKTLGNQINPIAWFTQLPYEPLNVWLKNELSSQEYGVLRNKYPKDL
jgi:hypothetical protein